MATQQVPSENAEHESISVEELRSAAVTADAPTVVPQRPKPKPFVAKPLAFLPSDIIRYIDELSFQERLVSAKLSPALDAVALATTSLRRSEMSIGKVIGIEASVENMRILFEKKIRVLEKLIEAVARLMRADEDGVEPKVFETLANICSDIYASMTQHSEKGHPKSSKLTHLLPLFHMKCLPSMKSVIQIKSLPHHTRLMICKNIEDMESWQALHGFDEGFSFSQSELASPFIQQNPTILNLISSITVNPIERSLLRSKLILISNEISNQSSNTSDYGSLQIDLICQKFSHFGMTVSLLDSIFNLILTCLSSPHPYSYIFSCCEWSLEIVSSWNQLDGFLLLVKLIDFSRILIAMEFSLESDIKPLFTGYIFYIFKIITQRYTRNVMWSLSGALKAIDVLCVCIERDFEMKVAMEALPQLIDQLQPFIEHRRSELEKSINLKIDSKASSSSDSTNPKQDKTQNSTNKHGGKGKKNQKKNNNQKINDESSFKNADNQPQEKNQDIVDNELKQRQQSETERRSGTGLRRSWKGAQTTIEDNQSTSTTSLSADMLSSSSSNTINEHSNDPMNETKWTLLSELEDKLYKSSFDYAITCFNTPHPEKFLTQGVQSITSFVNTTFRHDKMNLDGELLNVSFQLAKLFLIQKSDPNSFVTFFTSHMVTSFHVILKWMGITPIAVGDEEDNDSVDLGTKTSSASVSSDPFFLNQHQLMEIKDEDIDTLKKLCLGILEFAYVCIQAGSTNRYKFFCWFMPPIYNLVDNLPAVKTTSNDKMNIVKEIITTCTSSLQAGHDIDLLLRDGVPMVLNLFKDEPSQIASKMRIVATKLQAHGNFWALLQLNYCLQTSLERFESFASKEACMNYFKNLISRAQRKSVNESNEVCVPFLTKPEFYGIRNYIFATYEPELDQFQASKEYEEIPPLLDTATEVYRDGLEAPSITNNENQVPEPAHDLQPLRFKKYIVSKANILSQEHVQDLVGLLVPVFALERSDKSVMKIVARQLSDLLRYLEAGKFTTEAADKFKDQLSRVVLFKNLFPQVMKQHANDDPEILAKIFNDTFPSDVIKDQETMDILSNVGTRIEKTTTHLIKFQHVATLTTQILNQFLSWNPDPSSSFFENSQKIFYRKQYLEQIVFNMPQNIQLRNHLVAQGYSPDLFTFDLSIRVDIDDRRNLDELFKTNLSKLYKEYSDLLKELYQASEVKELFYEGAKIPLEDFFEENHRTSFTIEDLRSRRNFAIKMIDKKLKESSNRVALTNRKLSLLMREESMETQLEKDKELEGLNPPQRRRYWVKLNKSFLEKAKCCNKQISGCYAPNGDHAEKILENAFKANVCFLSLYESASQSLQTASSQNNNSSNKSQHSGKKSDEDEDDMFLLQNTPGTEIENIEAVFTDQGVYIFKLYTNGHNFDTSLAWLQFFKTFAHSGLVPSIIIPNNFPNIKIFYQLENSIPSQLAGSILTFKDTFFDESGVTSYYDIPIEKIKQGDIVLDEDNCKDLVISGVDLHEDGGLKSSGSRSRLIDSSLMKELKPIGGRDAPNNNQIKSQKKKVKAQQDLSGIVLTNTIKCVKLDISQQESLKPLLPTVEGFVRYISQYLSKFLETGIRDLQILTVGLDIESWNRRKFVKKASTLPSSSSSPNSTVLNQHIKNQILSIIVTNLHKNFEAWLNPQELVLLFRDSRSQFFELKNHWNKLKSSSMSSIQSNSPNEEDTASQLVPSASDVSNAKIGLDLMSDLMRDIQHVVSFDELARIPQENVIKWIFGNEDRVWRERGGRPGEESLQTFLNFCRIYQNDPTQLTKAQQQVRSSTQAEQFRQQEANRNTQTMQQGTADSSTQNQQNASPNQTNVHGESNADQSAGDSCPTDTSLDSFQGDHYGNTPWGGFAVFAVPIDKNSTVAANSQPNDNLNIPMSEASTLADACIRLSGSGASNRELIAYSIGDYISSDDFEVITAWVHPQYRSFGLAIELYKQSVFKIRRNGGQFITFDVLLGTVDHLINTILPLKILDKFGILSKVIVKRRNSHSSETEHGVEQFERLTVSIKWIVIAFHIYDLWIRWVKRFRDWMGWSKSKLPWRQWMMEI